MKKLIVILLMLSIGWQGFYAFADGDKEPKTMSDPITIVYLPADIPGAPRSVVPLECEYDFVTKSIMVTFFYDMGYVDVVLQNNFTGEYISATLNSADGYSVIPFNVPSGYYTITFRVFGDTFYGVFEI